MQGFWLLLHYSVIRVANLGEAYFEFKGYVFFYFLMYST
jgi:hypothetical protein